MLLVLPPGGCYDLSQYGSATSRTTVRTTFKKHFVLLKPLCCVQHPAVLD